MGLFVTQKTVSTEDSDYSFKNCNPYFIFQITKDTAEKEITGTQLRR